MTIVLGKAKDTVSEYIKLDDIKLDIDLDINESREEEIVYIDKERIMTFLFSKDNYINK